MVDLWQFLCYLTSEAPLCWIKSDAFCSLVLKCGTNFDCSSWKYSIYELLYNIHHPCLDGIKLQHQKEKVKTFICILNNHTIFDMCLCLFYTFHIFLHFIQKWMIETPLQCPLYLSPFNFHFNLVISIIALVPKFKSLNVISPVVDSLDLKRNKTRRCLLFKVTQYVRIFWTNCEMIPELIICYWQPN